MVDGIEQLVWFPSCLDCICIYKLGYELIISVPMPFNTCNSHFITQKKKKNEKKKIIKKSLLVVDV